MSAESDLLRVVLALQMGFVTKEQVVECGAVWADDRSRRLTDLLQEKGYLKPTARQGLDVMVKAKVEEYAGDPGQSLAALSMDHDIHQSILSLPLDEQVRDTLMKHDWARRAVPVEPVAPETIVVTKPREEERYRLGTELGRGGLGRVLVAEDTVLGREVAIKEMLEGVGSAQTLKRFLREGEVAGRLLHPNIVPVFDVGVREDGERKTPYFAMGKIAGRDLQVILRAVEDGEGKARHDFSRPRLLRIFQDVCLAMAYAHHHGVIHRDLKPANVMVGDFGEVYVVDWGLAKVMGEKYDPGVTVAEGDVDSAAPALTMDGQTLGTPAYMPPEQADGQIDEIDHQSDIYSLGAILYEILTFRPPFEGATGYNVIAKVLEGKLTPPSVRASEVRQAIKETRKDEGITSPESVPVELGEIVLKAMAKEKGTRYVTVMELHEEVQQYLDGEKQKEMKHEESVKNYEGARHNIEEWEQAKKDLVKIEARIKDVSERVKPF
jgi:serine/threonine-protein kinase